MELTTVNGLATKSGLPACTVWKMMERGVIPQPDIKAGREGYYSPAAAEVIVRFLKCEYERYKRYPAGHVQVPAANKEVV